MFAQRSQKAIKEKTITNAMRRDALRCDAMWCDAWPPKRKSEPQMNLSPFRQRIQIQMETQIHLQLPQQIH